MPTVSAAKIAKALNISERRVRQLVDEGVLRRESHGRYDLAKCVLAVARMKAERLPEAAAEIPGLTAERERRLRVQRERDEIRLAKERGELISLETFRREVAEAFQNVRDQLLHLPHRLATELAGEPGPVIEKKLDAAIRLVLTSLSRDHGHRDQPPPEQPARPDRARTSEGVDLPGALPASDSQSQ